MTTDTKRKEILEQKAQHVYHPVPARSRAVATEEPPAVTRQCSRQEAGIRPGDIQRMTVSRQPQPQRGQPRTNAPQEEEYDDALYPQPLPSSARRYKQPPARYNTTVVRHQQGGKGAFYTLIVGSSIVAGIMIALVVPPLWQRGSDQIHYGFPRTYQVDANVGHGTKQYPDTHFIALNLHGYVEVIEIPEGVPEKNAQPHLYLVARPDNANADQTPATLTFEDVNGDGKVDLIVYCNGNESILYNDGHTFKPTP